MKVGDLVRMPGSWIRDMKEGDMLGVVVKLEPPTLKCEKGTQRVAVLWSDDGGVIDWEPMAWLEVVSESR